MFKATTPERNVKNEEVEEGTLSTFDPNLLAEIFKHLDWDHLNVIGRVNRHWLSVCKNPVLLSLLEATRELRLVGTLVKTNHGYVRQLVACKGFIVSGGEAFVNVYDKEGKEQCHCPVVSEGMVESLVVWRTLGPDGEEDDFICGATDEGHFHIWRLDVTPKVSLTSLVKNSFPGTSRVCVWNSKLYHSAGQKVSQIDINGTVLASFDCGMYIKCIAPWDKDHLCVGTQGGMGVWTMDVSGKFTKLASHHKNPPIRSVHPGPNGSMFVTCELINAIQVFNAQKQWVKTLQHKFSQFNCQPFFNRPGRFVVSDAEHKLLVWDINKQENETKNEDAVETLYNPIQVLGPYSGQIYALLWFDGILYTGDYSGVIMKLK